MASIGPNSPGTVISENVSGATMAWANPSNAGASDNSYATSCNSVGAGVTSQYLKSTSFGFSIPGGATIDGIEVQIEKKAASDTASAFTKDIVLQLLKAGTIVGSNKADTVNKWGTTDSIYTYGGSSDLWGTTWTDSDINGSTFGCVFRAEASNGTKSGSATLSSVDHVKITVYYTGGSSATASSVLLAGD